MTRRELEVALAQAESLARRLRGMAGFAADQKVKRLRARLAALDLQGLDTEERA